MKPTARRRLGKYVLLGRLGAGGMGKIYLAHAPGPAGIDKLLVVKRLHSHLTNDPVLVSSFLDEARLSMALNHPNIVHTYDVGEVDGRYFMVMEYIDGQNMGVLLRTAKRSGHYPKSTTWAGLFLSVLDGLHAAHTAHDARGRPLHIIHRDVSPQNILITYDGLPKLVDFGIAKAAMRVTETDAGTLKGKYAYMSPEQVRGDDLDPRSDIFAAGIVLWEMLAGRRLYKAETIVRSVDRILNEQLISPLRVNPSCDPGLASVALKALQKDRRDRFATAEEFRLALEDALEATGVRYRPSDGRDLMHRLFADVIDKQRAVLEATLNRADEAAASHGDDDDGDEARRYGDSQSDLRMPNLGISPTNESTTPSSLKRSPLVTAEGDSPEAALPPVMSSPSVSRPTRPPPVTPAPSSVVLAPPLETGERGHPDAVTVTGGVAPRRERRSLWVPFLAACVGVILALGGVTVGRRLLADPVTATDPAEAVAQVLPPVAPVEPAIVEPAVKPAAVAPVAPVEPVEPVVEPAAEPAVVVVADPEPPARRTRRPARRPDPKPEPRPEPRPDPKPDTESVAPTGFLTLDTVPWTTVYLGKKKLGETPLVKVPVPSGPLELTLINADEGVREGYLANIKAGEVFRTRLDLR